MVTLVFILFRSEKRQQIDVYKSKTTSPIQLRQFFSEQKQIGKKKLNEVESGQYSQYKLFTHPSTIVKKYQSI